MSSVRFGRCACPWVFRNGVGGCSADRHQRTQAGVRDHDMIHAFNHPILVDELEEGLTMFVGADQAGTLLEVGIIDSSDGPIIIHAMPARPKYLR